MEKATKKIENPDYLSKQIITYIGNKRSLLDFIGEAIVKIQKDIGKEKLDIVDMFSGSGIVARYFKQYASTIIANDLEDYSRVINQCYLSDKNEQLEDEIKYYYQILKQELDAEKWRPGFITELYAPKDSDHIIEGERVFFTTRNALYIDTARQIINTFPFYVRPYFIAPLLAEASVKNNTAGVFKGFYKNSQTGIGEFGGTGKNALSRIKADIELEPPILSEFDCSADVFCEDANTLVEKLPVVDVIYMDPPYNQHPYGSNYFMLNLIANYERPKKISEVSGIPADWHRSNYNKKREALEAMYELCRKARAKYLVISFNSEGFISKEEMLYMLSEVGSVEVLEQKYNVYRASRNLHEREIYVYEYLFIVKKDIPVKRERLEHYSIKQIAEIINRNGRQGPRDLCSDEVYEWVHTSLPEITKEEYFTLIKENAIPFKDREKTRDSYFVIDGRGRYQLYKSTEEEIRKYICYVVNQNPGITSAEARRKVKMIYRGFTIVDLMDQQNLSSKQDIIDQTIRNVLVSNKDKEKKKQLFHIIDIKPYRFEVTEKGYQLALEVEEYLNRQKEEEDDIETVILQEERKYQYNNQNAYSEEELEMIFEQNKHFNLYDLFGDKVEGRLPTDVRIKITRYCQMNCLCEGDHNHHTFASDTMPNYLVGHHMVPMAAQRNFPSIKLDCIQNMVVLCPTCHSQIHYGTREEKLKIFNTIVDTREEDLKKIGFTKEIMKFIFDQYY